MTVSVTLHIIALAHQAAFIVILHQSAFNAAVHVIGRNISFHANPFPPAAMTMVVVPVAHLSCVAVRIEQHLLPMAHTHFIMGNLQQFAFLRIELPHSVAVLLVQNAFGKHIALRVIHRVVAHLARHRILIAYTHLPVGIIIGKSTCLQAVYKLAFVHLGPLVVGLQPMALSAALSVNFILCLAG